MRATYSVPKEDTLMAASVRMRENGAEVLPVTEGHYLRGIITENSLARALANGALDTDGVEVAFVASEPTIRNYETGAEALRRFEDFQLGSLVVIDDDRRVVGILRASDLISPPKVAQRPALVGGMATPFGVYLTSGDVRAGAQGLALVTTGMTLAAVLLASQLASVYVESFLDHHHVKEAVSYYASMTVMYALFAAGFRFLPISKIHAAEHMVVHAIERGEPLIPSVVRRMPRVHPRCGTNLVSGMIVFTTIFAIPVIPDDYRPLVALVCTVLFWRRVGSFVQYWITTSPPREKHIKMGIRSAEELLAKQANAHHHSVNFFTRLWNSGLFHVLAGSSIVIGLAIAIAQLVFHTDLPG